MADAANAALASSALASLRCVATQVEGLEQQFAAQAELVAAAVGSGAVKPAVVDELRAAAAAFARAAERAATTATAAEATLAAEEASAKEAALAQLGVGRIAITKAEAVGEPVEEARAALELSKGGVGGALAGRGAAEYYLKSLFDKMGTHPVCRCLLIGRAGPPTRVSSRSSR